MKPHVELALERWARKYNQNHDRELGDSGTMEKKALSIDETCRYVGGISRPTLYGLLKTKAVPSYTIGRRRYIMRSDLDAYLKERQEGE
jgi:excisionase family DNA binding protein